MRPVLRRAGRLLPAGLDRLLFPAGLAGLAFLWGLATMIWQVFPHSLVAGARAAWAALSRLDPEDWPPGFMGPVPGAERALPVILAAPGAGAEALLVTGGFYQATDLCPRFGCMAWVMDRSGRVLHRWEADPAALFADVTGMSGAVKPENFLITGVALDAEGGLITVFQSRNMFPYQVGIARFDKGGRLLWKRFDRSHHWPGLDADGTILVPVTRLLPETAPATATMTRTRGPRPFCAAGTVYSDGLRRLGPDGAVLAEFWLDDILAEAALPGLAYGLRDGCNPHHLNGIAVVTPATARPPATLAGDLVLSLREPSALLVVDGRDGRLRRVLSGPFAAQHSPRLLPGGEIVVFDNLGGGPETGGSRLVAVDPLTGTGRVLFPLPETAGPALPFLSEVAGTVEVSADGTRLLVAETRRGRILEIETATGRPLFILDKLVDISAWARARDLPGADSLARFNTQGAVYVGAGNPVLAPPAASPDPGG